jgi:hypothetical protein
MPRRSNDFQRLVLAMKAQLADGATINESEMLPNSITSTEREVDICIHANLAGHEVLIAVECKAEARPATVSWVEEMMAKHRELPTHLLVLASQSGFTREAIAIAHAHHVETLAWEQLENGELATLLHVKDVAWGKTLFLVPQKILFTVEQVADLEQEVVRAFADNLLYTADGVAMTTAAQLVQAFLNSESVLRPILEQVTPDHKWFETGQETPHGQAFLLKLNPRVLRRIIGLSVAGPCHVRMFKMPLNYGRLGEIEVAWSKGEAGEEEAMVVLTKPADKTATASITFSKKKP